MYHKCLQKIVKFIINYIASTCFYETPQKKENEICIEFSRIQNTISKICA